MEDLPASSQIPAGLSGWGCWEEDLLQSVIPAQLLPSLLHWWQLAAFTVQLSYEQQWSELVWKLRPPLQQGA